MALHAGAIQVADMSISLRQGFLTLSDVSVTGPAHLGHHTVFRANTVVLRLTPGLLWRGAHKDVLKHLLLTVSSQKAFWRV